MSAEFMIGFGAAIVLGLLFFAIMQLMQSRKGDCEKIKFDERQVVARGKAFQAGFFALLGCVALAACLEVAEVPWLAHGMGPILAILIGVSVFALVAIHKDAYMGLNQNPRKALVGFGLIMLVNLICGVTNLSMGGDNIWQGRINLAVTSMMLLVIAAQGIHLLRLRKEQEDE